MLSITDRLADVQQRSMLTTRDRLDAGLTTVAEVMDEVLDVAAATEPYLHAYVSLDPDLVRTSAGRMIPGPLHGMPIGIKDLFLTVDHPTRAGSTGWREPRRRRDAVVVRRIREAGGIVMGKQCTHEFGYGMNEPTTRNPRDPLRYAGGSTIGGAVSVAVGSSLGAIGTDGGGSIRKPASVNGLVGLKPTYGLVGTDGIVPGVSICDHVGWITGTVADSALLLSILAPGKALVNPVAPVTPTTLEGTRLGCPQSLFSDVDPMIGAAVRAALTQLSNRGAVITDIDIPELAMSYPAHDVLVGAAAAAAHRDTPSNAPHSDSYDHRTREYLARARSITDTDVHSALEVRNRVRHAVDNALTHHKLDALVSPTLALGPVLLSEFDPWTHLPKYCRLTLPFNLTGHPAVSVPCGTADGMPVGLQIIGRLGADSAVLSLAAVVEENQQHKIFSNSLNRKP